MDRGWDGDVELHEGGYWSGSLCAGVGGSGGAGGTAGVRGADSVVSGSDGGAGGGSGDSEGRGGVGGIWLCFMSVFWVECGNFVVVVVVWKDLGLVLWSGWRMALWCWNGRGDFLRRFSLKSVAGTRLSVHVFLEW